MCVEFWLQTPPPVLSPLPRLPSHTCLGGVTSPHPGVLAPVLGPTGAGACWSWVLSPTLPAGTLSPEEQQQPQASL